MRTLYLRRRLLDRWPTCAVFHVTPFLRQLIVEIVGVGRLRIRARLDFAFLEVLLAELRKAPVVPTGVELPADGRAAAVARAVVDDGQIAVPLGSLCKNAGVGIRTLQRVFRRELGVNFETWRRQVRLMKAIERLVAGDSVKQAAFDVGYQESNALVSLFRSSFGLPPKAWMSSVARRAAGSPAPLLAARASPRASSKETAPA